MVVVIDHDQVAQLQVASGTRCFTSNALHSTAITKDTICMIVNDLEPRFVEMSSGLCLSYR